MRDGVRGGGEKWGKRKGKEKRREEKKRKKGGKKKYQSNKIQSKKQPITPAPHLIIEPRPRLRQSEQANRLAQERETEAFIADFLREDFRCDGRGDGPVGPAAAGC